MMTFSEFKKQYYVRNFEERNYQIIRSIHKNILEHEIEREWKNKQEIRLTAGWLTYKDFCRDIENGEDFNGYDDDVIIELLNKILDFYIDKSDFSKTTNYITLYKYSNLDCDDIDNYYLQHIDFECNIIYLCKE